MYGGFEGNAQTLRILTKIEKKIKRNLTPEEEKKRCDKNGPFGITKKGDDLRCGLNLTYRSLASILKYDFLIPSSREKQLSQELFNQLISKQIEKEIIKKSKMPNLEFKGKIKKEIDDLYFRISFQKIQQILMEYGIINDEKFLSESCLDEIIKENVIINKFGKDQNLIINALVTWSEKVKFQKGYYQTEKNIVKLIKKNVCKDENVKSFKTIECQIMDIADDIAYSTYDFEDALKAKFVSITDCIAPKDEVLDYIKKQLNKNKELLKNDYNRSDVINIFKRIFEDPFLIVIKEIFKDNDTTEAFVNYNEFIKTFQNNGYERINLTSSLIARFISGVEIENDDDSPLMKIKLREDIKEEVEALKNFTYKYLISSNLLKIPEYRGYEIVKTVFDALKGPDGHLLLPEDYRDIFLRSNKENQYRIICDFIAGMTDRYVLEFYGRLTSENPQSIFKPI
jgi:predicted deoxyguanosinetriphosphate triphosphohydrolase